MQTRVMATVFDIDIKNYIGAKINNNAVMLTTGFILTLPTMRAISGHLRKPGKYLNITLFTATKIETYSIVHSQWSLAVR